MRTCLFLLFGCFPVWAFAEYTVTIKNLDGDDFPIQPYDHSCIHDPNYFEKVVPAHGTIKVHAKWIDGCPSPGIRICPGSGSDKEGLEMLKEDGLCVLIEKDKGDKCITIALNKLGLVCY